MQREHEEGEASERKTTPEKQKKWQRAIRNSIKITTKREEPSRISLPFHNIVSEYAATAGDGNTTEQSRQARLSAKLSLEQCRQQYRPARETV